MLTQEQFMQLPEEEVNWHEGKMKVRFVGYLDPRRKSIKKFVTIHHMWEDWNKYSGNLNPSMKSVMGKWMYFYQNQNGIVVDLISMPNYLFDGHARWESCSQGRYCENPETFPTQESAERVIKRRLTRDSKK